MEVRSNEVRTREWDRLKKGNSNTVVRRSKLVFLACYLMLDAIQAAALRAVQDGGLLAKRARSRRVASSMQE